MDRYPAVAGCVKFRKLATKVVRTKLQSMQMKEWATLHCYSLCLMVLASCSGFSFAQQQPFTKPVACSPQAKTITVWKVGSPYYNGAPGKAISTDLKMKAKSLGCTIQVEAFPAVGFADSFFAAFDKHQEPDVLVVENKGAISGITMRSGELVKLDSGASAKKTPAAIDGIASNKAVSQALEAVPHSPSGLDEARNWVFLLRTSRNYNAAQWWLFTSPDSALSGRK